MKHQTQTASIFKNWGTELGQLSNLPSFNIQVLGYRARGTLKLTQPQYSSTGVQSLGNSQTYPASIFKYWGTELGELSNLPSLNIQVLGYRAWATLKLTKPQYSSTGVQSLGNFQTYPASIFKYWGTELGQLSNLPSFNIQVLGYRAWATFKLTQLQYSSTGVQSLGNSQTCPASIFKYWGTELGELSNLPGLNIQVLGYRAWGTLKLTRPQYSSTGVQSLGNSQTCPASIFKYWGTELGQLSNLPGLNIQVLGYRVSEWWFNAMSATENIFSVRTC